jgi:hypothetical protein
LAKDRIGPSTYAVIKELRGNNLLIRIQRIIAANGLDPVIFQVKGLFTRGHEDLMDVGFPHISPPRFLRDRLGQIL